MNETTKLVLRDIVHNILEELNEIKSGTRDEYHGGQINAYTHILRTMTGYADADELRDIGLDFDIDRKYA
ncbi:MAG: hypothetical protein LBE35_10180 [Clostridiales bacterium]|nr:hypothetical protein [Clostridiales bacterium]